MTIIFSNTLQRADDRRIVIFTQLDYEVEKLILQIHKLDGGSAAQSSLGVYVGDDQPHWELHICELPKLYFLLPPSKFSSTNKFFSHFTFLVSFNICKHSIILLAVGVEERT